MCVERQAIMPLMCVDKPSAMMTYVRGGIGNQILVGWSRGTQQEKEEATTYHPNLRKKFNHNCSLHIVPITINRRGRIIRYKSS